MRVRLIAVIGAMVPIGIDHHRNLLMGFDWVARSASKRVARCIAPVGASAVMSSRSIACYCRPKYAI